MKDGSPTSSKTRSRTRSKTNNETTGEMSNKMSDQNQSTRRVLAKSQATLPGSSGFRPFKAFSQAAIVCCLLICAACGMAGRINQHRRSALR